MLIINKDIRPDLGIIARWVNSLDERSVQTKTSIITEANLPVDMIT